MSTVKQLSITRTQGEWEMIRKKLCPANQGGDMKYFSKFMRREVLKLKRRLDEIPESIVIWGGEGIEKKPYIEISVLEDIKEISVKTGVSESTIIHSLIINPLLAL
jgi:hypothetical protein